MVWKMLLPALRALCVPWFVCVLLPASLDFAQMPFKFYVLGFICVLFPSLSSAGSYREDGGHKPTHLFLFRSPFVFTA